MSMATQTGASCAITISVTVGLLCGVVCCKNHCRDLRHGDDHLLRYLGAAQAVIASQPASFRRCYGPEYVSGLLIMGRDTRHSHRKTSSQTSRSRTPTSSDTIARYGTNGWTRASLKRYRRHKTKPQNGSWTYNNDRPNMAIGGITPAMKLNQYKWPRNSSFKQPHKWADYRPIKASNATAANKCTLSLHSYLSTSK